MLICCFFPTVLPDAATTYQDYYNLPTPASHQTAMSAAHHHGYSASSASSKALVTGDPLDGSSYGSPYSQWAANGYGSYQYNTAPALPPPPPPQSQYPSAVAAVPPPMVLCPQMFSTVNQNQIHVHLHPAATPGSDKLEQYFGENGGFMMRPAVTAAAAVAAASEVGGIGGTHDPTMGQQHDVVGSDHHQQQDGGARAEETVAGDPSSVWRPY